MKWLTIALDQRTDQIFTSEIVLGLVKAYVHMDNVIQAHSIRSKALTGYFNEFGDEEICLNEKENCKQIMDMCNCDEILKHCKFTCGYCVNSNRRI